MSKRYQNGYLRCAKRRSGLQCWKFLWREDNDKGKRVRCTAIIGTVAQLPTEQLARTAANELRVQINSDNNRCGIVPISGVENQKLVLLAVAGLVAFLSFRSTEKWKRAEFLADEMKEFFGDERVQRVTFFIDWRARRMLLHRDKEEETPVTRELQVRALRPQVIDEDPVSHLCNLLLQH